MTHSSSATDPEKEHRLNVIIAEYLKRKDEGKKVSKDSMLKAHPDLADGLRSYFAGEAMMDAGSPAFAPTSYSPKGLPSDGRETVRPGAMESDTASEFESKRFGRYQLLRPLGEGAMGNVYLALDTTLDRQVALKVPKTEGTSNAEFMARFTREARAAAGLKHPNICSVYDAGEHEGTAFITMDYIDGVPLSRFIGSSKLQSVDSILQMITIIAEAVGHAHSKGVIHRDLKPGNILVDNDFKPHVTDFGLARRTGPENESRITQEGLLIGTPAYMAPEQVRGEQSKVSPESDIYSLGVILFELLTARLPFEGKVGEMLAKVLRDNPPVPSHIRKDLCEDVDDICLKMLMKEPGQRYSSMADVIAAIKTLSEKTKSTVAASVADGTIQQKSPFEIQKAHIEVMLKKGQYVAAIQELEKLAAEKSPGAKAVGEWARATLPAARAESKALSPAGLAALLQTGQQMFEKSDYQGCIQLLDDVPSLRRTEAMEDLLGKARKREAEAERLLSDIKDMERCRQIDGLEPLVKKLLKLKPGNIYARRLMEALQTYSKTPAARRNYHYDKGRLQPMAEPSLFQRWAVLGLLVGVLTFLSVTYYAIFYLKSSNQTLAVHVDDEWLKSQGGELTLVVDGNDHTITAPSNGGEPLTVTVTLGEHTFSVKHGNTVVHDPKSFDIERDGRKVLSITATDIRLENGVPVFQPTSKAVASTKDKPAVVPEPKTQASDTVELTSNQPSLAIAPFDADQAAKYQQAWATAINQPVEIENSIGMKFRLIPPGEFLMGSPTDEPGRYETEKQHPVRISKPFYMGAHEVTRAQFEAFVIDTGYQTEAEADGKGGRGWDEQGEFTDKPEYVWRTPGFPQTDTHPVVHVSWNDAKQFTEWLSERDKAEYRLATEAEWEFACRAGTTTMYSNGNDAEKLVSIANIADASTLEKYPAWTGAVTSSDQHPYTAPVGTFQGNAFGLHDLHGNVWEWCQDRYDNDAYQNRSGTTVDPLGQFGESRVIRDGGWSTYPEKIRAAARNESPPTFRFASCGFRVVRTAAVLPAVAPFTADQAAKHQQAWASYLKLPVEHTNSVGMKFRLIPPAKFSMGSTAEQIAAAKPHLDVSQDAARPDRIESEGPQQVVTLTRPFYLGITEVTQLQYKTVTGQNPSAYSPEGRRKESVGNEDWSNAPVESVKWINTVDFCNQLSIREKTDSAYHITPNLITQTSVGGYRLPTEAEWEFACRAGTNTLFSSGDDDESLKKIAWFSGNNTNAKPKPVAQLLPNPFGLFDMHGNAWEQVHDAWQPDSYQRLSGAAAVDPRVDVGVDGSRIVRGGSHWMSSVECRSACRDIVAEGDYWGATGFRVALSVDAVRQLQTRNVSGNGK